MLSSHADQFPKHSCIGTRCIDTKCFEYRGLTYTVFADDQVDAAELLKTKLLETPKVFDLEIKNQVADPFLGGPFKNTAGVIRAGG